MLKLIKKIFGDKHEKDLKVLWPIVKEINDHYETIKNLTDDELKNKTKEFKEKIQAHTESTRKQIEELKKIENGNTSEDLETIARNRLNMVKPNEIVYIDIGKEGK